MATANVIDNPNIIDATKETITEAIKKGSYGNVYNPNMFAVSTTVNHYST